MRHILAKNKRLMVYCLLIFAAGVLSGIGTLPLIQEDVDEFLIDVFSDIIVEGSNFQTALNILTRNLKATFILAILGFTIIVPVIILFSNGFIAGLVLRLSVDNGLTTRMLLLGTLPHGILELFAFFTTTAVGIRMGLNLIHSRKQGYGPVKESVREGVYTYFFLVIPLLIITSFIESYVTSSLIL